MIVGIHGLGDNPDAFKGLFVGLHHPARLILPRAIDPYEEGWSWFPFRARDPDVGALAEGIGAAETKLAAALAQIVADRPTVGKPIVTGFSQGGMLTFAIAVRHPELVGEAIAIGGSLPPPLWPRFSPKVSVPIVALHGTADNAVAFEPTRAAVEHLRSLGYDIQLKAYPDVRHVITEEMHHDFLQGLYEALARTRDETNR
jgi:phospholipase/carboxylesterase